MKGTTLGIAVLIGVGVVVAMYKAQASEMASQAQHEEAAAVTRPRDLALLKRPAVRSACTTHLDWDIATCLTIDEQKVSVGMTAAQARLAWGKPDKVNTTTFARGEHQQWVYGREYLYLDDGVLRSMQTTN